MKFLLFVFEKKKLSISLRYKEQLKTIVGLNKILLFFFFNCNIINKKVINSLLTFCSRWC